RLDTRCSSPRLVCTRRSPFASCGRRRAVPSFPTRRSSDLGQGGGLGVQGIEVQPGAGESTQPLGHALVRDRGHGRGSGRARAHRSEEHTSELQSRENLVCRLLLEKKKTETTSTSMYGETRG